MGEIVRWDNFTEGDVAWMERRSRGKYVEFTDHQAALDEVVKEAVWAMEWLASNNLIEARMIKFLDSDLVKDWRTRQEEQDGH